jgi:hypothetical protein
MLKLTRQGQHFVSYENGRLVLVFIEGILPPFAEEELHDIVQGGSRHNGQCMCWREFNLSNCDSKPTDWLFPSECHGRNAPARPVDPRTRVTRRFLMT